MKKGTKLLAVLGLLTAVVILLLTSGCKDPPGIVGTWVDDSGYMVQFTASGEFSESIFALKMPYTNEGTGVLYYMPDGNAHYSEVDFDNSGRLLLHINGDDRVFKLTSGDVTDRKWEFEQLPVDSKLQGKYVLKTALSVKAELRLLDTQQFSLSWAAGSDKLPDWFKPSDTVQVGIFANRGLGSSLLLYTDYGKHRAEFKLSPTSTYAATYPLTGTLSMVKTDYSSKVTTRGFLIAGTLRDEALGITYRFGEDKTLTKTSKAGTSINYSYFVNDDGLLSMSCTDAVLPTDFMWVDSQNGQIYRAVFERDNWTDYMASTALLTSSTSIGHGVGDPSNGDGKLDGVLSVSDIMGVIDAETVVDLKMDISPLLPGALDKRASDFEELLGVQEAKAVVSDWVSIQEQVERIKVDMETRQAMEDAMLAEHQEYLDAMRRIADERKAAEEEQRLLKEQERLEQQASAPPTPYIWQPPWVFATTPPAPSPTQGQSYLPGGTVVGRPGTESTPPGLLGGNFGAAVTTPPTTPPTTEPTSWAPPQYIGDYGMSLGKFTVNWVCNCIDCHKSTFPVASDAKLVAAVDSTLVEQGRKLVVGTYNTEITTVADPTVNGYVSNIYVTDHIWASQQRSSVLDLYPAIGG